MRNALSQLSLLAGRTNYSDRQEVEKLYKLGDDVFYILTIHAADENDVTLAELEKRCPGSSHQDLKDHEQLDVLQDKLEQLLLKLYTNAGDGADSVKDGEEFYLLLSEFHARYLEHTAGEERVTQQMLWKHFSNEEFAWHRGKIMARNPPQTLLLWFRFVLPAQSHQEKVGLLTGFKKIVPPPFFNEGMEVIRQVLTEDEFASLKNDLILGR